MSKRVKEVDVVFYPERTNELWFSCFTDSKGLPQGFIKAKIVFEVPERKVTISESEFDKAYEAAVLDPNLGKHLGETLKEKLFGKDLNYNYRRAKRNHNILTNKSAQGR